MPAAVAEAVRATVAAAVPGAVTDAVRATVANAVPGAVAEAANACTLIVSTSSESELPAPVRSWIRACRARKCCVTAAVVALLGPAELVAMIEAEGVPTKIEATGKIFPVSDRATGGRLSGAAAADDGHATHGPTISSGTPT